MRNERSLMATCAAVLLAVALAPAGASGQPFEKTVGGHIGIATPLVTIASETTSIADQFTLLNPIGIGVKVSEHLTVDFETVVATAVDPSGPTVLVVDPGVVYGFGSMAAGLRIAWQINHEPNFGLIPLFNVGLVNLDGATWFIEAALPTFYQSENEEVAFNVVLHTGVGF